MKPKVFVNSISKNIKNNKELYHFEGSSDEFYHYDSNNEIDMIDVSDVDVRGKINEIFNSDSFVFKSNVEIILKDGDVLNEDIIAVKDNNLITLSDKKISIDDIKDIKKAK